MKDNTPVRVVLAWALWAGLHSLLASDPAKRLAAQVAGRKTRKGLYRATYNGVAFLTLWWATIWQLKQPNRTLYDINGPMAWLMRLAQATSLALAGTVVLAIGPRFTGLPQIAGLVLRGEPGEEPEAQGPPPHIAANGEVWARNKMDVRGPFKVTRHPGNWLPWGLFIFSPKMTRNRAILTALYVPYVLLGSMHEEARLRKAYGEAYEEYRRKVPFLL